MIILKAYLGIGMTKEYVKMLTVLLEQWDKKINFKRIKKRFQCALVNIINSTVFIVLVELKVI